MVKAILALNFDGLCQDLNDAVAAIVVQGLFVDDPPYSEKRSSTARARNTSRSLSIWQIPLDLPATYIRLFYLRPDKVHILQAHLINTASKLSARIQGVISDGAHFTWNGNSLVAHQYTNTTERNVLEHVVEIYER